MNMKSLTQSLKRHFASSSLPIALVLLLGTQSPYAQEVYLIQEKPDPAVLARIMFPSENAESEKVTKFKLRSIRFTDHSKPSADAQGNQDASEAGSGPTAGAAIGFNIHFALNSPELSPETLPYIDSVGEMLLLDQAKDAKLTIAGHADASGDSAHNLALSRARAAAVASYLEEKFAISADRISTRGYGESTPLPNADPYDAMNRRVEFHPAK